MRKQGGQTATVAHANYPRHAAQQREHTAQRDTAEKQQRRPCGALQRGVQGGRRKHQCTLQYSQRHDERTRRRVNRKLHYSCRATAQHLKDNRPTAIVQVHINCWAVLLLIFCKNISPIFLQFFVASTAYHKPPA